MKDLTSCGNCSNLAQRSTTNSAAGEPITSMIALVNDIGIPENEMEDPTVRACQGHPSQRNGSNVVNVIATEHHCHLQDAIVTAMVMRDRIMCRFLHLRDVIAYWQSAPTRHYLQDLGHVV
jgi:phomopsene synthease